MMPTQQQRDRASLIINALATEMVKQMADQGTPVDMMDVRDFMASLYRQFEQNASEFLFVHSQVQTA